MPTIGSTLRASARRTPDAPALAFDDRTYTYAELDAAVDKAAAALAGLGLAKGDRLALMAPNSDHFVITFYAAVRLGVIFVPVVPSAAPPELEYLLTDSGATTLVFDPAVAPTVNKARTAGLPPTLAHLLSLGESDGQQDLLALTAGSAAHLAEDHVTEADDALILYTSGTTGRPKGALFDHHRVMWTAVNIIATCNMRIGDRLLHSAPLCHGAQLCIMLIPGTLIGAKHIVLPGFDAATVLATLEAERVTMYFGVPTMFQFLLRRPDIGDRDLSAWRTGLFGAAPMPASTVEQLTELLPHVEFMQLCGQTEGGPGGIYLTGEQVRSRPDASGRQPLPLTESRVVSLHGQDTLPGEVGELVLRGETVMKGYWNKPAETAEALRDGWLHTGDLARVDGDGFVTLVDRLKDLIITGGRNVYSVEVENALAAHPDITDCAVIGRPHPDYGESIVAVVTPREGADLTLEDVRGFCRERLASYKVPHVLILGTVPRNPSGKLLKYKLRSAISDNAQGGTR
ncbi:class I adenylate-forming enzyme family protein [Streptomyces sp. NPDC056296]|uniref:class I adenylate-forming enzyme family protein n=1 Tax=Streptomyces sp. NPDC056296 TaxID=3345775 RepID=UPI0035DE9887